MTLISWFRALVEKTEAVSGVTERETVLGYAQTLAAFAGLQPGEVNDFRKTHNRFVLPVWWEYRVGAGELLWRLNREFLREAWEKRFDIGQSELMRLLTSVFDPTWTRDVIFRTKERPPSQLFRICLRSSTRISQRFYF